MISNNYKQNKWNFIKEHEKRETRQLVVVARVEKSELTGESVKNEEGN